MHREFVKFGLVAGMLIGLGLGDADAAPTRPMSPEALGLGSAATPAAMCGFSCRSGGRYIPGPPSVCYERGLNYCGPSRGWGGPPRGPGYYDRGPYGRGPGPYGGGGGYGRGPGRYDEGADGGRRGGPGGQGAYERGLILLKNEQAGVVPLRLRGVRVGVGRIPRTGRMGMALDGAGRACVDPCHDLCRQAQATAPIVEGPTSPKHTSRFWLPILSRMRS